MSQIYWTPIHALNKHSKKNILVAVVGKTLNGVKRKYLNGFSRSKIKDAFFNEAFSLTRKWIQHFFSSFTEVKLTKLYIFKVYNCDDLIDVYIVKKNSTFLKDKKKKGSPNYV